MGVMAEFLRGLKVTGRIGVQSLFGKGIVTTEYPKEFRTKPKRFHVRGRDGEVHRL